MQEAQFGGDECFGSNMEIRSCNNGRCPGLLQVEMGHQGLNFLGGFRLAPDRAQTRQFDKRFRKLELLQYKICQGLGLTSSNEP